MDSSPAQVPNPLRSVKIPLVCSECGLPHGHLVITGGMAVLQIESRHHGKEHLGVFALGELAGQVGQVLTPVNKAC